MIGTISALLPAIQAYRTDIVKAWHKRVDIFFKPWMYTKKKRRNIMDIQTLQTFFMWCTVINGSLLVFWTLIVVFASDWVYRTQSKWFPISREVFNVAIYSFLGLFKIVFLVFNAVPYIVLLIIGNNA
jgi:hypothetical protein